MVALVAVWVRLPLHGVPLYVRFEWRGTFSTTCRPSPPAPGEASTSCPPAPFPPPLKKKMSWNSPLYIQRSCFSLMARFWPPLGNLGVAYVVGALGGGKIKVRLCVPHFTELPRRRSGSASCPRRGRRTRPGALPPGGRPFLPAKLSLLRSRCLALSASLSLPHSLCLALSASFSLPRYLCLTLSVSLSLPRPLSLCLVFSASHRTRTSPRWSSVRYGRRPRSGYFSWPFISFLRPRPR